MYEFLHSSSKLHKIELNLICMKLEPDKVENNIIKKAYESRSAPSVLIKSACRSSSINDATVSCEYVKAC
jgi:hypothetical protein